MVTEDVIDLSKQRTFDVEGFKESLIKARRYMMDVDPCGMYDLKQFNEIVYVLNWLIEDVDYIDIYKKEDNEK